MRENSIYLCIRKAREEQSPPLERWNRLERPELPQAGFRRRISGAKPYLQANSSVARFIEQEGLTGLGLARL
jgi:hypothetical protein